MSSKLMSLIGAALIIALAGCGGGGGGGSDLTAGVTINVGADTVYTAPTSAKVSSAALSAPLDNGAEVKVYNFQTGQLIKTATITNGWCRLDGIPAGLSLAIVVTGNRDGKPYRLSTLVPVATDADIVANPVTSVAAEAFCSQQGNYASNKVFSEDDWQPVLEAAEEFVTSNASADFSVGGGIFSGSAFGQPGSLNPGAAGIDDVIDAVEPINSGLSRAKNTVTLMQEAGTPLRAMIQPEGFDFQNVFTEQVLSRYQVLAQNMGKLMLPVMDGDFQVGAQNGLSIFDLTVGHKYAVTDVGWYGELILADQGLGTAGQITIERDATGEDPSGIYTVVAKHVGSSWELTQTFSGDSAQEYKLTVSDKLFQDGGPGANPTLTGSLSLTDSVFTTPVTLQVTASATGTDPDAYTKISFSGTLTTPQVSNTGTYSVEFATSIPAGAGSWQTIHDFPKNIRMTNARTVVKVGAKTITIAGDASATMQFVRTSRDVVVDPANIQFTGSYVNTHTGLNFNGEATFNATWVAVGEDEAISSASARLTGSLEKTGHPTYSVDISINKSTSSITTSIELVGGIITLTGNGTVNLDSSTGEPTSGSVTLTSSNGAVISFAVDSSGNVTGNIKVDGQKYADIVVSDYGIRINFTDGTFKEFII